MQETSLFKHQAPSATAENRFGSPALKVSLLFAGSYIERYDLPRRVAGVDASSGQNRSGPTTPVENLGLGERLVVLFRGFGDDQFAGLT